MMLLLILILHNTNTTTNLTTDMMATETAMTNIVHININNNTGNINDNIPITKIKHQCQQHKEY